MKSTYSSITIFLLFSFVAACKKDSKDQPRFGWASNGKKFFYNQYKGSAVGIDYLELSIGNNQFFQNDNSYPAYMAILDQQFIIKEDGLTGLACNDCRVGFFCNKFEFLYAPANPALNQQLLQYSCGRTPVSENRIITLDTTVAVPLGTFKTYVIQHQYGDRSYWNADNGIIMYEKVDPRNNTRIVETYKLSRVQ